VITHSVNFLILSDLAVAFYTRSKYNLNIQENFQ
jgi:hypothetical protein